MCFKKRKSNINLKKNLQVIIEELIDAYRAGDVWRIGDAINNYKEIKEGNK